ncbi:MAG: hypothetical protein QF492_08185 [Candidatus Krumholzibacteria bacterium]|jgi:glycosyltransferase involved in cell wall biosynthesis|nr:hypothetical protein [Candidatus Krumholzibacteria bacterium]MDP6798086.1 hypothetical protein [Candidatus Krumholzibacteria bacterium]MDP7021630.1 hypothetical protein [Candidatus Krumholzibacteria bacterium]
MKRLLMISYYYPPMGDGGVFRCLKFSSYLREHGWEAVVLSGDPEDYWVRDESLLEQLPEDQQVSRVGGMTGLSLLRKMRGGRKSSSSSSRSSSLFRFLRKLSDFFLFPDSYRGWIAPARKEAHRLLSTGDFDLIFSSGPPDSAHLLGHSLAREFQLPWVADFRDLWYNLHLKDAPTPLHRFLHSRLEAGVLRDAEVVTVTRGWQKFLEGRKAGPVHLIRNGYDPADFEGLHPAGREDARLHLLHTGKLSLDRSSRPFLEGLSLLLQRRPDLREQLRVEFLGPSESDNENLIASLGLSEVVRFRPSLPHREALSLQLSADLLLLLQQSELRYRDLVPGKLYEYMGSGRPVFAVGPGGEVSELVRELGLGWMSEAETGAVADLLEEALEKIRSGWKRETVDLSPFERPGQAKQMAEIFDSLERTDSP